MLIDNKIVFMIVFVISAVKKAIVIDLQLNINT